MTSLLDTARRLVQLGEAARQPHVHGPDCYDGDVHLCGMQYGEPEPVAARSADRLAAALIEAEAVIARLCAHLTARETARADVAARQFLSSLNAKPGDAS
jgi:hypothetical protein